LKANALVRAIRATKTKTIGPNPPWARVVLLRAATNDALASTRACCLEPGGVLRAMKRAHWRDDEITLPLDRPRPVALAALTRVTIPGHQGAKVWVDQPLLLVTSVTNGVID
jgi:hypothetical protein